MRIVALSADASLAAALNMSLQWEVAYATEPEEAAEIIAGASVVLIGGGTEEGLRLAESLRTLGVTIPAVVVGDDPAPEGARHPVLSRPFTLDELNLTIEQAAAGAAQSPPAQITPEPPAATPPKRHLEVAPEPPSAKPAPAPVATRESTAPAEVPAPPPPPVAPAVQPPPPKPSPVRRREVTLEQPAAPAAAHTSAGRNLLGRKPKAPAESVENEVSVRLRAAFDGVKALESAIEGLPVLTDLVGLTQALLGEVVDLLTPETAAVYLPGPDGFRVWASHNFSQVEKTKAVQTHQPLFADLLVRHQALLIEPLDMAQTLANGVGGARTNAFLAAPMDVDRICVGIIVAGRGHFEDEDLDRLEGLAVEAALGLGIALGLDRLKQRFD